MLCTALNLISVGGAVGMAILVGYLLPPAFAWPLAAFLAAGTYVLLEAVELAVAGRVVARRPRRVARLLRSRDSIARLRSGRAALGDHRQGARRHPVGNGLDLSDVLAVHLDGQRAVVERAHANLPEAG